MDYDGIIFIVQQNIENLAVFFGVVADELAVHPLHHPVDGIALDGPLLHAFQDMLHVTGGNGDVHHLEFLLQGALSARFIECVLVDDSHYAYAFELFARARFQFGYFGRAI